MTNDGGFLFMGLLSIHIASCRNVCSGSLPISSLDFSIWTHKRSSYIQIRDLKTFFLLYDCLFTPLIVSFDAEKFQILNRHKLPIFSFVGYSFSVIFKKLLHNQAKIMKFYT